MKTSPLLNKSSRIRRVATHAAGTLIALSVTSADEFLNFNSCECLFLFSFRRGGGADVAKCLLLPSSS